MGPRKVCGSNIHDWVHDRGMQKWVHDNDESNMTFSNNGTRSTASSIGQEWINEEQEREIEDPHMMGARAAGGAM